MSVSLKIIFFVNYKINQFFQKTPFFADFSLV